MIYYVYSLESPRCGDSNKNTQYAFMFKKIEKISLSQIEFGQIHSASGGGGGGGSGNKINTTY